MGEIGATEVGGDKAAWVEDFFAALDRRADIRGFTWFNYDKETDWRVESSPGSLAAFRAGLCRFGRLRRSKPRRRHRGKGSSL